MDASLKRPIFALNVLKMRSTMSDACQRWFCQINGEKDGLQDERKQVARSWPRSSVLGR